MSSLSKSQFKAIQRALRHAKSYVSINHGWKAIHNEWGVGHVQGRVLHLSPNDRVRLRQIAIDGTGADPLHTEINGDRVAVAGQVRNEKWSPIRVFEGLVQVASSELELPTIHGPAQTPRGTALSIEPGDLDLSAIDSVVVVENGAVLRHWHSCAPFLPPILGHTVAVYRGHDSAIRYVTNFVAGLPAEIKRVGFFDYDPAGLSIALQMGVDFILVPPNPIGLHAKNKSDSNRYEIQQMRRIKDSDIRAELPKNWVSHAEWIVDNRASISQEAMLACMANTGEQLILVAKHG